MGTSSTGNDALDHRINQLMEVLDDNKVPYDALTYQALVQTADEMRRFMGFPEYKAVETEQDEVSKATNELVKAKARLN